MSEMSLPHTESLLSTPEKQQMLAPLRHFPRRMAALAGVVLSVSSITPFEPALHQEPAPKEQEITPYEAPVRAYDPLTYVQDIIANSDIKEVRTRQQQQALSSESTGLDIRDTLQLDYNVYQEIAQRYGLQLVDSTPMRNVVVSGQYRDNMTFSEVLQSVQEYMSKIGVTIRFPDHANDDEKILAMPDIRLEEVKLKGILSSIGNSFLAYMPKDFIDAVTDSQGLEIILTTGGPLGLAYTADGDNRIAISSSDFGIVQHEVGHLVDARAKRQYDYDNELSLAIVNGGYQFGSPKNEALTANAYRSKKDELLRDVSKVYKKQGYEACLREERLAGQALEVYASTVFFVSDYAMTHVAEDKAGSATEVFNFNVRLNEIPRLALKEELFMSQLAMLSPAVGGYVASLKRPARQPLENTCLFLENPEQEMLQ